MKKYFYIVFFLTITLKSFATHIVGGEIELVQVKNPSPGITHEVTLNLYFDAINGRPAAEDISITLTFIRKRDLARIGEAVCQRVYRDLIQYIDPACSKGDLQTLLIKYRANLNLPETTFSDPGGYAIVWERCCRNTIITNIRNPSAVGMVFYTEFPPVTIANNSPHFKDVVADYLCINQNFEMDFSATDPDGDSLTYELITPWIGYSTSQNPNPVSIGRSSYPEATWVDSTSLNNVIPGPEPLRIDRFTGVLFVKPDKLGLYVFSVMVNEYRKGIMIGRVKRDFQLKVVDCKINIPPQVMVKSQGTDSFFKEGEIITIKKGDKRCFDILYFDPDINQKITITARGVNFDTKKINIPAISNILIQNSDTLKNSFCLDDCIITKNNQAAEFILSIYDNGCPVPQIRNFRMRVNFEDVDNNRPVITTSLVDLPTVMFGDTLEFTVFGDDEDKDTLSLAGSGRSFSLGALGFTFPSQNGIGRVKSVLRFIPNCEAVKQKQVILDFVARDFRCGVSNQTTYAVPVVVQSIPNNSPIISTDLSDNAIEVILSPTSISEVKFEVEGLDIDEDVINLIASADGFDFKSAAMNFDAKEGIGKVKSIFTWLPNCALLEGKDSKEFLIKFFAQDKACDQKQDTVGVRLVLKNNLSAENPLQPFNTFTPNDDGFNDYFNLGAIPEDNCNRQFVKFEIFNRYGKLIYTTPDRNFRWSGDKEPTGDYFYLLHFSDEIFKGIVHLIR
ncbi:gliding motility-associated C-terminal domain-containing protein [Emticicia sp. BO119]|uniref:T9SS type B sorting domain-containing protein n=1 Tax=Emticicia sp. BO119 TaxID=2757768 RepID=UPI0015F0DD52|nr:gliding motility-associated C-terminal domain-containing protein [Emticicia sp. BO119]MBA4853384.1 gliding motility-associated C-terminal domain-containing protein [Emticicia sp. BO119]